MCNDLPHQSIMNVSRAWIKLKENGRWPTVSETIMEDIRRLNEHVKEEMV